MYLRGLLSACERKSIEPMALHLGVPIRPLQYFIGQSTWPIEPIVAQHQLLVGSTLAEEDGVFLVDECGVVKQGHDSVGVAPQYCGSVGTVANSQVGVYLGYASHKGYTLLDGQLFIPELWFGEAYTDKRKATEMPTTLSFQTKPEIALELLRQAVARLLGMRWPVELTFEQGKGEVGMEDYEVRSWQGWQHHMVMVMLAHHFLVWVRLEWKDRAVALTLNQVRLL